MLSYDSRSFAVNVKAVINVSQVVVEGMIQRKKGGSIVNISSQASQVLTYTVYSYVTNDFIKLQWSPIKNHKTNETQSNTIKARSCFLKG